MEFQTKEEYFEFISKLDLSTLPKEAVDEVTRFLETEAVNMARKSFYHYVLLMGPTRIDGFKTGRHIEIICNKLQELSTRIWQNTGRTEKKMISLPPGGMKSELCSRLYPSWLLGVYPKIRLLIVGHGIEFAVDEFGAKIRDIVRTEEYKAIFPDTILKEDKQAAGRFLTKKGGEVVCSSLEAKIAGRRAHLVITDDALVEDDAMSKPIRMRLVGKYVPNVRSRLLMSPDCGELAVGCLTQDTQILKADGTYEDIVNLKSGDLIQTLNHDTFKMEVKPVIKQWKAGRDKIYELHTANGDIVKGNYNHPFLLENGKYCKLGELVVGDNIVLRAGNDINEISLSGDKSWLLGFMYGDGWLIHTEKTVKNRPSNQMRYVTCVAKGEHKHINDKVISLFKSEIDVTLKETCSGYYRSDTRRAWEYFNELGFSGNAHTKRLPKWLFKASPETRQKFLEGFLEADGWEVGDTGAYCTELCNRNLVKDIKKLAQSLGYKVGIIRHRTRVSQPPNSPEPFIANSYSIHISREKYLEEFVTTKVLKVVNTEIEDDIYDLEVADNHNFIAEGLVTHNTRWIQGDLFDYLEETDKHTGSPWDILKIPAILDEETSGILRKKGDPEDYLTPGTSFWPEFQPTSRLMAIKGSFEANMAKWNAVYMQNPTPEEGQLIDRENFRRWRSETPPNCHTLILTADTAYTKSTQSDYTAYQLWGLFNHVNDEDEGQLRTNAILLNAKKGKWDYPELCSLFEQIYRTDRPDIFLLEERSSGLALIPDLIKRGLPVYGWKTEKDKRMRMQTAAPMVKSGLIWVPYPDEDAEVRYKSDEFISEIVAFPGGNHDDVPDAFSQFILFARDNNMLADTGYIYQDPIEDPEEGEDDFIIGGSYTSAYLR